MAFTHDVLVLCDHDEAVFDVFGGTLRGERSRSSSLSDDKSGTSGSRAHHETTSCGHEETIRGRGLRLKTCC